VFEAIESEKLKERFPGEVRLSKRFDGSISNWIFKLAIRENPEPLVAVFISEEPIWNRLNLNAVRMKAGLTRRETDVMRRALEGLKNSEIADELDIGEQTVKDYLSNVYSKLNVTNKFSMLRFLVETSLPT
jgi:DNA-binding NarL/FixJ family response regulator